MSNWIIVQKYKKASEWGKIKKLFKITKGQRMRYKWIIVHMYKRSVNEV